MRTAALQGLAQRREEIDRKLLSRELNGEEWWVDPHESIGNARVTENTQRLQLPIEEERLRYEAMTREFGLRLDW